MPTERTNIIPDGTLVTFYLNGEWKVGKVLRSYAGRYANPSYCVRGRGWKTGYVTEVLPTNIHPFEPWRSSDAKVCFLCGVIEPWYPRCANHPLHASDRGKMCCGNHETCDQTRWPDRDPNKDLLAKQIEGALLSPVPQWMLDFWEENPGVMAYFLKLPDE